MRRSGIKKEDSETLYSKKIHVSVLKEKWDFGEHHSQRTREKTTRLRHYSLFDYLTSKTKVHDIEYKDCHQEKVELTGSILSPFRSKTHTTLLRRVGKT